MKKTINTVLFWLLCAVVSLPCLFRGLFFEKDFLIFVLFFSFLFLIALITKNIELSIGSLIDITIGIIVILYIVMTGFAANIRYAGYEAAIYLSIYLIYILIKSLCTDEKKVYNLLFFSVLTFTLVTLIGLLTAAKVLNFPGAYSAEERWINSTLQYHNAFGALTLTGIFICVAFDKFTALKSVSSWVLKVCLFFLSFGFITSYSRGAWVLLPVLFVMFFLFAGKEKRIGLFALLIPSFLSGALILGRFTHAVEASETGNALLFLGLGLLVSLALFTALSIFFSKTYEKKYFKPACVTLIIASVLAGIVLLLNPSAFSAFLPAQLIDRLSTIRFATGTVTERFVFYKDAFQIVKLSPLFGLGGGAWKDLYFAQQSYLYFSEQPHSYIMQIWIECGTVGLLAWLATIVVFYTTIIKTLIKSEDKTGVRHALHLALLTGSSALILHSFIDFDLSIPSLMILLWSFFALYSSLCPQKKIMFKKWILYIPSLFIILFCSSLLYSSHTLSKADTMYAQHRYQAALGLYKTASMTDPLNSLTRAKYADCMLRSTAPVNVEDEALSQYYLALHMAPNQLDVLEYGIPIYSLLGNYDEGLLYVEKMINSSPLNPSGYESYFASTLEIVRYCIKEGALTNAKKYANQALDMHDRLIQEAQKKNTEINLSESGMQMLESLIMLSINL